jgi:uncharacterized repeat protein (TIGR01451 family)
MNRLLRAMVPPAIALGAVLLMAGAISAFKPVEIATAISPHPLAGGMLQAPLPPARPAPPITITILHTNDFHGQLLPDPSGSGGSAYMATLINNIRAVEGEQNVVLMDAGDVYFASSPFSQLVLGKSTIEIYNMLGYDVAAYGNHEFDKGQSVLLSRTLESDFDWIGANIVVSDTTWTTPDWSPPYITLTVGPPGEEVVLGIIGLDTDETPEVTVASATAGLVFKGPTETVKHYYHEVEAQSDGLIVLAHIGAGDDRPYKGLERVAQELIDAGMPVGLMIGGHQHEVLFEPRWVGDTAVVEAGYHGKWLGRARVRVDPAANKLTLIDYELVPITTDIPPDPDVQARVAYWVDQVAPILEQPVGSTYVSLTDADDAESMIGDLVTDGMRWSADQQDDGQNNGSIQIAFIGPWSIRDGISIPPGAALPHTITWGGTFNVLPFGGALYVMELSGYQLHQLLDQVASMNITLPASGLRWRWYNSCQCTTPWAWGVYGIEVNGRPLDLARTYRLVVDEYLAGGGAGLSILAHGTSRWDTRYEIQQGLNAYIGALSPIRANDIVTDRITPLVGSRPNLLFSHQRVADGNGDGIAQPGEIVSYSIVISNSGEYRAGILLTDRLPSGLTYLPHSLRIDFPGSGFTATLENGMLVAHSEDYPNTPRTGSLPFGESATVTLAAQVSDPAPVGSILPNNVELSDQFSIYAIAPAVLALEPPYSAFVPLFPRGW